MAIQQINPQSSLSFPSLNLFLYIQTSPLPRPWADNLQITPQASQLIGVHLNLDCHQNKKPKPCEIPLHTILLVVGLITTDLGAYTGLQFRNPHQLESTHLEKITQCYIPDGFTQPGANYCKWHCFRSLYPCARDNFTQTLRYLPKQCRDFACLKALYIGHFFFFAFLPLILNILLCSEATAQPVIMVYLLLSTNCFTSTLQSLRGNLIEVTKVNRNSCRPQEAPASYQSTP